MKNRSVKRIISVFLAACMMTGCMPAFSAAAESAAGRGLVFDTTVSADMWHMAAIKKDGSLWTWGYNGNNMLGTGDTENRNRPVKVLSDVISVDCAYDRTTAIRSDKSLWNWGGRDKFGELGREAKGSDLGPGKVMDNVKYAAGGAFHNAAVTDNGTLWMWGENGYGQLGIASGSQHFENDYIQFSYEPLPVKTMTGIVSVYAGYNRSMALDEDGGLWAWGECAYNELFPGIGGNAISTVTKNSKSGVAIQNTPVKLMDDVAMADIHLYSTALKKDGTVLTWGYGRTVNTVMEDAVFVATGGNAFAAIKSDGSLWTWTMGLNEYGEIGRKAESPAERHAPGKVMDDVVSVAVGGEFMAALKSDGTLWTWGRNQYGQLGNGTNENSAVPVKIMDDVALPVTEKTAEYSPDGGLYEDLAYASYYNGNAYIIYQGVMTWEQADKSCRDMGGHLVTITSKGELDFINGICKETIWLGARADANRNWNWITGEKWSWSAWREDEPNNSGGSEDCIIMAGGSWIDVPSSASPYQKTFICEWENEKSPVLKNNSCIVYFDANGGSCKTASKTAYLGGTYGTLPAATKNGYIFTGWFTEAQGGSPVMASDYVYYPGIQKVYAHYSDGSSGADVPRLTYQFGNNYSAFGYSNPYQIPYSRFAAAYGDNDGAKAVMKNYGSWNGNCFGMSSTAMLINNSAEPAASSFRSDASVPSQLVLSDKDNATGFDLLSFIETMQVSQFAKILQQSRDGNKNKYSALVQDVLKCQNGGDPVIISIKGPRDSSGSRPGHAVVGYAAYRVADQKKDIIKIYDPNFPGDSERMIDLYYNSKGEYTGWYYKMNDKENWGSGYDGGFITYSPFSQIQAVWNNRGKQAVYDSATLSVSSDNAAIYDYSGDLMARIVNGEVITDRTDVFAVESFDGDGMSAGPVTLWVPAEYLTVVNEDNGKEFSVSLESGDRSLSVTTAADSILCYTDGGSDTGTVYINERNKSYDISITTEKSGRVDLKGVGSDEYGTCLSVAGDKIRSSGVDPAGSAKLSIDGKSAAAGDIEKSTLLSIISGSEPTAVTAVFTDVPFDAYYAPAVEWAYKEGITSGILRGFYMPDKSISRAEAVTMLWRAAGKPEAEVSVLPFKDTPSGSYYYDALVWAYNAGIIKGTGASKFDPAKSCSQSEILEMIWNMLGRPGEDSEIAAYKDAYSWAKGSDILAGTAAETSPSAACTRKDAAVLLYRALQQTR